ncbi:histone-like nucleoid-structuring protein Lsr2 [Lentzea sp. JNUCC 0626]|uniref:Lsr2 dimerization domain-containing protein n=1 Tax=Lentzea sp. JNUCC 0626 TaxID=3367513 RepID=UPI003747AACB
MVLRVDDIDRNSEAHETIRWSLDGKPLKIDLSQGNATQMRAELAFWASHSRPEGRENRITRSQFASPPVVGAPGNWWQTPEGANAELREQYKALRQRIQAWGEDHGWNVGTRGRIPYALANAWKDALKLDGQDPLVAAGVTDVS